MRTRWKAQILAVVLALSCHGGGATNVDISVGNEEISIDLPGLGNPCELQTCPDNQRCTVVYHPGFLDVPVAHCLPKKPLGETNKDEPLTCVELKIGSNAVRCKTKEEWNVIGHTQCALRGGSDTSVLADMQVTFACHSFGGSSEPVFLQAHFKCCPRLPVTTAPDDNADSGNLLHQIQDEVVDDVDGGRHYVIMYPVIIAMAILVSLLIIIVAVWQRRRSKRGVQRSPKVILATSFVNPSADVETTPTYDIWDEYTGRSDKSMLVANEQTQFTPGN